MTKMLVTDELWAVVEPLLPPESPKPKGGRPRVEDRAVLAGILFVLKTGIPWEMLPKEMGYGSGMTCWRRLREWQATGIWEKLTGSIGSGQLWTQRVCPPPEEAKRRGLIRRIAANRAQSATL